MDARTLDVADFNGVFALVGIMICLGNQEGEGGERYKRRRRSRRRMRKEMRNRALEEEEYMETGRL